MDTEKSTKWNKSIYAIISATIICYFFNWILKANRNNQHVQPKFNLQLKNITSSAVEPLILSSAHSTHRLSFTLYYVSWDYSFIIYIYIKQQATNINWYPIHALYKLCIYIGAPNINQRRVKFINPTMHSRYLSISLFKSIFLFNPPPKAT